MAEYSSSTTRTWCCSKRAQGGDGVQDDLDAVNGSGEGDPTNQGSGTNEEEDPSNGETTPMPDEDTMDVLDVPPATGEQGESGSSDGPCPLTAPEVGTACENLVSYCAYGDSPFVECREVFSCNFTNNQWQVTRAPNTSRCQNTPQESCPETVPEGSCEPTWAQCAYPDAACTCVGEQTQSCGGDGCYELDPPILQQWSCREGTEECPLSPPNAGAPCDADTPPCVYGEDCTGIFVRCVDGYVQWVENLCA